MRSVAPFLWRGAPVLSLDEWWVGLPVPQPPPDTTPPYCSQMAVTQPRSRARPTLIPHHSWLNEVGSNATENQIIWRWHLLTVHACCVTHQHLLVRASVVFLFFNDSLKTTISSRKPGRPTTYRNRSRCVLLSGHAKKCFHVFNFGLVAQRRNRRCGLHTARFVCK